VRRVLQIVATVASALALLAVVTIGALVGLNAECNGAADECPRSDAYRGTLLALPVVTLVLLLAGAVWAARRRALWPLVLAEAAVLGAWALTGAAVDEFDTETAVLLLAAAGIGWAALGRRVGP
jgi:hypothetical protein